MFKGKVRLYRNINWKEESINKEFNNEKDFNAFVESNPEFKNLWSWEPISIQDDLSDINNLFEEASSSWQKSFFDGIKDELKKLKDKSKKLLWK